MNTTTTTSQPLELEAAYRAQRTAARIALPAMLTLLPLAVVTAACSFVTRFLFALDHGRDVAGEVLDAADLDLPADVRAVADVILAAVAGHTAPDMIGPPDSWELEALAEFIAVVQTVRREVITPRSVQGDTTKGGAVMATADDTRKALDAVATCDRCPAQVPAMSVRAADRCDACRAELERLQHVVRATRGALGALCALATELRNDALQEYARDLNDPDAGDAVLTLAAASPLLIAAAGDILSIAGVWGNDHALRPHDATRADLERMRNAARVAVQLLDLYLAATEGV